MNWKKLSPQDKRHGEFASQRERFGFDDTDLWTLDQTIAKFALDRLKRFKEIKVCHPTDISSGEWDDILQKMIDSFEEILLRDEKLDNWDLDKVDVGLNLFVKYFHDLWT